MRVAHFRVVRQLDTHRSRHSDHFMKALCSTTVLLLAGDLMAEEHQFPLGTALSSTDISGYVHTDATVYSVPEPSPVALIAIGGVVMAFVAARRRKG